MGRNLEKDAVEMAAKNQRILENGFRIFAENTIESVTMNDVAKAAGIAVSSLYRYYSTKPKLVIAVGAWAWNAYMEEHRRQGDRILKEDKTAAELFDFYLESFLDMYRHHRDLLRFNQFFNIYMVSEAVSADEKKPYIDTIQSIASRFELIYRKARTDGTLCTDISKEKMFSVTVHLMLSVVTRYAVGLVYEEGTDAEEELRLQKQLLMDRFVRKEGSSASRGERD